MKDNQWWKYTDCKPMDDRGELDLTRQIEELKKKVHEAEGELSIIKGIGNNSPEMKRLQQEVKELREDNKKLALQISDLTNNRRYHEGV
jgi:F0F1-type ATP synthase beta subunit